MVAEPVGRKRGVRAVELHSVRKVRATKSRSVRKKKKKKTRLGWDKAVQVVHLFL